MRVALNVFEDFFKFYPSKRYFRFYNVSCNPCSLQGIKGFLRIPFYHAFCMSFHSFRIIWEGLRLSSADRSKKISFSKVKSTWYDHYVWRVAKIKLNGFSQIQYMS